MPTRRRQRGVLVLGIVLTGLLIVLVGAFYVQNSLQSITVRLKGTPYMSLGESDLVVLLTFELTNPSLLSANIVSLHFSIELADYPLGTGNVSVPFVIPANGRVEGAGRIQIPYSLLPAVTLAAIRQYLDLGTLKYRIYGLVTLRIIILDATVPFDLRGDVFETLKERPLWLLYLS